MNLKKELLTNTDRTWIINHTQNRRRKRKNLKDYLDKNHEIFTLQYTLNIKHNEIDRLENHLHKQEHLLNKSEKDLLEDISLFDQFLETFNRNTNDATLRADEESREKEELINEIKQLQKVLFTYRNDQKHLIDLLKQARRYQQFLFKFAPEDWCDDILQRHSTLENYSIYFTKPEQLLNIFTDMEEKSLPLIEKSQHTYETLDQIQLTINRTIIDEDNQVEQLQLKINHLEESIKREIDREISCQNLLIEYQNSKNNSNTDEIRKLIEILYKKYINSNDSGISTIHMLQTIENKIKNLFNHIENLDPTLVIQAEKSREITVRTAERQEKLQKEKLINNLKHEKALLRASSPPYLKVFSDCLSRGHYFETV